jgi:hypothetical protein
LLAEIERLLKRSIPVVAAQSIDSGHRPPRDARPRKQAHDRAATRARHDPPPQPIDRNPDQPPRPQASQRIQPAAALTATASAPGRSWHKNSAPVPALLMKRPAPEPESA